MNEHVSPKDALEIAVISIMSAYPEDGLKHFTAAEILEMGNRQEQKGANEKEVFEILRSALDGINNAEVSKESSDGIRAKAADKGLTFSVEDPSEISLPGWISRSELSLSEIGAATVIASLNAGEDLNGLAERIQSPEMLAATKSLKAKGIFSVSMSGGKVNLLLDLDKISPPGESEPTLARPSQACPDISQSREKASLEK